MVFLRGQKHLEPCPYWSPLGVKLENFRSARLVITILTEEFIACICYSYAVIISIFFSPGKIIKKKVIVVVVVTEEAVSKSQ